MKSFDVQISPGFYIGGAFAVLLLPWKVVIFFGVASAVHELCHLAVLRILRVPIHQIKIGFFGACLTTGSMTPQQELICAAAGPAGSLCLTLTAGWMPVLALFGLVQGAFNLLPIYPLDGGRVVRAIFMLAKKPHWDYNSPDY